MGKCSKHELTEMEGFWEWHFQETYVLAPKIEL